VKDVAWLTPEGGEMDDSGWNTGSVRSLGMLLSGSAIEEMNERGEPIIGDTLLVLLNGYSDTVPFTLPPLDADQQWQRAFDTFDAHGPDKGFDGGKQYDVQGRSIVCFKLTSPLRRRVSDTNDAAAIEAAVQA
jgi:glycogen operon protein